MKDDSNLDLIIPLIIGIVALYFLFIEVDYPDGNCLNDAAKKICFDEELGTFEKGKSFEPSYTCVLDHKITEIKLTEAEIALCNVKRGVF